MFLGNTARFTKREYTLVVMVLIRAIAESYKLPNIRKLAEVLYELVVVRDGRLPSNEFMNAMLIVRGMDLQGIVEQSHGRAKAAYHKPLAMPKWRSIKGGVQPYLGSDRRLASICDNKVPQDDVMVHLLNEFLAMTSAQKKHDKSYYKPYYYGLGTQDAIAREQRMHDEIKVMLSAYRHDLMGSYRNRRFDATVLVNKLRSTDMDADMRRALEKFLVNVGLSALSAEPERPVVAPKSVAGVAAADLAEIHKPVSAMKRSTTGRMVLEKLRSQQPVLTAPAAAIERPSTKTRPTPPAIHMALDLKYKAPEVKSLKDRIREASIVATANDHDKSYDYSLDYGYVNY